MRAERRHSLRWRDTAWPVLAALFFATTAACQATDEMPAGEIVVRVRDPAGLSAGAQGQILVLLGVDADVGSVEAIHMPDPEVSPNSVVEDDLGHWFRPIHRAYVRDDVTLRGFFAVTASPAWTYWYPERGILLDDPVEQLGVAAIPPFRIESGVVQGIEVDLLAPSGELAFLTEDSDAPNTRPAGLARDEWGEAVAYRGNGPLPPSLSVLIGRPIEGRAVPRRR